MSHDFKHVLKHYLLSRTLIYGLISSFYVMNVYWFNFRWIENGGYFYFSKIFDAKPFLQIADSGYLGEMNIFNSPMAQEQIFAFFPLYPIVLRIFDWFTPFQIHVDGLLLNLILGFVATWFLFNTVPDRFKHDSIFLFLYSPITFFLAINYSETLFLALSVASFYFFKKKKWLVLGVLVGLSMLTRNAGFILMGVYGLYFLQLLWRERSKATFKVFVSFSIVASLIGSAYPLYLYIVKGNPFYFVESQRYYFKIQGWILDTWYLDFLRLFETTTPSQVKVIILITFVLWCFLLWISIKSFKYDWVLGLFLLIGILYPLVAKIMDPSMDSRATRSLMRYMLGLFPVYILIPHIMAKYPLGWRVLKMVWVILAAVIVISNLYLKFWD